jgi:hypothetical protein
VKISKAIAVAYVRIDSCTVFGGDVIAIIYFLVQ